MPEEIRQILTNKEAIAINQDSLGKQAIRYSNLDGKEIWIKELSRGNWAFCFLNTGKSIINMQVNWRDFSMLIKDYTIRDIWRSEDKGTTKTSMKIYLNSNDALFLKLTSIP
jgi:alpha-galactosidase